VQENSPRWLPRAFDEQFFQHLMAGVRNFLVEIRLRNVDDPEWSKSATIKGEPEWIFSRAILL
jgi:hypothetical protein